MSMARVFCFFWPRCSWGLRCFGSHRKHGLHAANWRNSDQGLAAMETIRFTASSLPLMARNGPLAMSDLSPLSGVEQKSILGPSAPLLTHSGHRRLLILVTENLEYRTITPA